MYNVEFGLLFDVQYAEGCEWYLWIAQANISQRWCSSVDVDADVAMPFAKSTCVELEGA